MRWPHGPDRDVPAGDDDDGPAASPVEPFEYSSPGLRALLAGLSEGGGHRILDLGPVVPANLEVYSRFARVVRFVDLLRDELAAGGVPPGGAILSAPAVARLLPERAGSFDVVLAWDLPSYLDGTTCRTLMAQLAACGAPHARLVAMLVAAEVMSEKPLRFELREGGRVSAAPVTAAMRGGPNLAPAEEQRRLEPFVVDHSVLLRHGLREYLAVLR